MMNEVMNTEKGNPYSFYVVLADGITAVPQSTFLWRMCWKTEQASTVSCFMILPIPQGEFESTVLTEQSMEQFRGKLTEQDRLILQLRY